MRVVFTTPVQTAKGVDDSRTMATFDCREEARCKENVCYGDAKETKVVEKRSTPNPAVWPSAAP